MRGPDAQHGGCGQQLCGLNLRLAKKLGLNCSHHREEMIIVSLDEGDEGVTVVSTL